MKTPAQYQHEIAELHLDEIDSQGLPGEESGKNLSRIEEVQEKLRQIEMGLNFDMHALRSQFHGRQAALNAMTQRRVGGKNKAEEEQRIAEERENKLGPYEEIHKHITEQLAHLDQLKGELGASTPGAA
ncbi:MAG: hypothetical protein M1281_02300 [Chloroflexi bacterium]|nr:hypothetical protein [Chloroflexota bacterium]